MINGLIDVQTDDGRIDDEQTGSFPLLDFEPPPYNFFDHPYIDFCPP